MDNDSTLYNNLGLLMLSLGRKEEALKSWQRSIELDPGDASPWLNRAAFYQNHKSYDRAFENWKAAERLGGQGIWAYYYRALAHRARGEPQKALKDLEIFQKKSNRLVFNFGDDPLFRNAQKVYREISEELASRKLSGKSGS
jgi:tetratricopeptide (TPR) repeat protein